jgi:hypothetical protein
MRSALFSVGTVAAVFSLAVATLPPAVAGGAPVGVAPHNARGKTIPRPLATASPLCPATLGTNAFVGGMNGNVADGPSSAVLGGADNQACDGSSSIAGGYQNSIFTASTYGAGGFIGGGEQNAVSGYQSAVVGGDGNTAKASYAFVGAGGGNTASGMYSFVGSGYEDFATGGESFVGNGGLNLAAGADSFVGDGSGNQANTNSSFVGGGNDNVVVAAGGASGGASAFIGGGYKNSIDPIATGGAQYAVVTGGVANIAYGTASVIGGGSGNRANGEYASIPGGLDNNANGIASFAAGTKARAIHNGTFVWSDGTTTATLQTTAANQFLARASGGYYLYSNAADTIGVRLAPGSGTWASVSDRAAKSNIAPLDVANVLEKVATLPVSVWSYRSEDARIRHVGPMAQDFYAAFGVGEDDRHITTIDEDGVALAAIKGLYAKSNRENRELRAQIGSMHREVEDLAAIVASLRRK